MNNKYILYLNDTIRQLIDSSKKVNPLDDGFKNGIVQGYYESISRLLNQAEGFEIIKDLDEDIQNFNPESLFTKNENGNT